MTDPIADAIIRIKNASLAFKDKVILPYSKIIFAIVALLAKEGLVGFIKKKSRKGIKFLEVDLKYENGKPVINGVKRISKPGRRMYIGYRNIKLSKQGFGKYIISTPQGLMTDKEAKKNKIGGEILFEIW